MPNNKKQERLLKQKAVVDALKEIGSEIKSKREDTVGKKLSLILARDSVLLEQIEENTVKIFKKVPKASPSGWALKKSKEPVARHLNLVLSDLHFGAALDGREVPVEYGSIQASRRLSAVIHEAASFKLQYRPETILNVHILGDIIQGQLHDMRDGEPLAEQVAEAQHLLCRAIQYLSHHFPEVHVRCTTGNHGRNTARHHSRATLEKWDSTETHIYHALKMYCEHLPNVTVDIPRAPYITFEGLGHNFFLTHGDTVLLPGTPQSSIDVKGLVSRTNEINASAKRPDQRYGFFGVGHVHFASMFKLPTGPFFLTNGALIPTDAYGVSLGHLTSACGQWLFETVPGHVVGHSMYVEVDSETDKNKALDKIIPPYTGF